MTLHDFFLYAAILGGALFLVQIVLSAIGAGDADIDLGGHHPGSMDHGSDLSFKLLSLQGLSSFFAMFGLMGLALHDQTGLSSGPSLAGALVGGWLTTLVIARLFKAANKLEGSGTINLANARDAEGTVYLRIAPNKPGKVTVTVQGRQIEVEATGADDGVFETGERVRVLRALSNGMLEVTKPLK